MTRLFWALMDGVEPPLFWAVIACGGIAFLGAWGYCAATYGFLLGFGLGWLPAGILAHIVMWVVLILWPLLLLAAVGLALTVVVLTA